MAEQPASDRKSQLISQLERSRSELAGSIRGVRHDLDFPSHLRHAFMRQKTAWIVGAVITGWLISRIPARKKPAKKIVESPVRDARKTKERERAGLLLGLLSIAGTILKPAATAFVSKKVAEYVEKNSQDQRSPRYARR